MAAPARPPFLAAAGLFIAGLGALFVAWGLLRDAPAMKPASSGTNGEITVYAQTVEGPKALTAERTALLRRPQAFAFQLSVVGSGPRLVRIDAELEDEVRTLHETRLQAPADRLSLDFVARFDERAPDRLALLVTVEAPHLAPVTRRYPVEMVTRDHRFWDGERARE